MVLTTVFLTVGLAILLPIFIITKNDVIEVITITVGVTLYHFAMRLAVGYTVNFVMKNKANHNNAWFREKSFENKLYKLIGVRKWKKYLPTYSPDTFDTEKRTVEEIIGATCQAEIVHEIIMILSLLPITLIPSLGSAPAFVITSVLSMLFDSMFVILQRFNRPKFVKIMKRFRKLTPTDTNKSPSPQNNS